MQEGTDHLAASTASSTNSSLGHRYGPGPKPGSRLVSGHCTFSSWRARDPHAGPGTRGRIVAGDGPYHAMDWLQARPHRTERPLWRSGTARTGPSAPRPYLGPLFGGTKCALAKLGHSSEGKCGELRIVLGRLTNREGCPVAVKVLSVLHPSANVPAARRGRSKPRVRTKSLLYTIMSTPIAGLPDSDYLGNPV